MRRDVTVVVIVVVLAVAVARLVPGSARHLLARKAWCTTALGLVVLAAPMAPTLSGAIPSLRRGSTPAERLLQDES